MERGTILTDREVKFHGPESVMSRAEHTRMRDRLETYAARNRLLGCIVFLPSILIFWHPTASRVIVIDYALGGQSCLIYDLERHL